MTKKTRIVTEWLASEFAALCLCQQWLYMTCILLGLQLNTINIKFEMRVLLQISFVHYCQIFLDRSTTRRVIAKIKRVPVF